MQRKAGHGWKNPEQDRTMEVLLAFLKQHLGPVNQTGP